MAKQDKPTKTNSDELGIKDLDKVAEGSGHHTNSDQIEDQYGLNSWATPDIDKVAGGNVEPEKNHLMNDSKSEVAE